MIEKHKRKPKEKGYKEGYTNAQVVRDQCAIRWEINLCKFLKYKTEQEGKSLGEAILELPNEYRWNNTRAN